jgi:hypothetical protein
VVGLVSRFAGRDSTGIHAISGIGRVEKDAIGLKSSHNTIG